MALHFIDALVVRTRQGYIFDPKDSGIGLTRLDLTGVDTFNNNFSAACTDPVTDTLYFIYSPDKLGSWATGVDLLDYEWLSKVYQMPYAAVPEAAQVRGEPAAGDEFSVYADGTAYYTKSISDDGEFVLARPTFGAKEFQMGYTGTGTIKWLEASDLMEELV